MELLLLTSPPRGGEGITSLKNQSFAIQRLSNRLR